MKAKKTRWRKKLDAKHEAIVAAYKEMSATEGSRMAMWAEMERRTGYTREGIQGVLRSCGIEYRKQVLTTIKKSNEKNHYPKNGDSQF